ncbi:MAG: M15 family metallopeptidase [Coriobacteriia bacterium]|nr:M15 family metallopeptidase [Coriobacteriia bacterium]
MDRDFGRRRTNPRRVRNARKVVALFAVVVVSAIVVIAWTNSSIFARETEATFVDSAFGTVTIQNDGGQTTASSLEDFDTPVQLSTLDDTGMLELVNRNHAASVLPLREDMSDAWPDVAVINQSIGLHPVALTAVTELLDSGHAADYGPFHVASGFRDWATQALLYEQIVDSSLVQPPGHSEHHTGFAIDIVPTLLVQQPASLSEQLDGTSDDERWLAENSWRYGLILRYPLGTQDITGITFEPWHFRYVGQPHAWYMWYHDLTLEEYLQQLRASGGYDVTIGKHCYAIRWSAPEDGVIYVPSDKDFTFSRDNKGGYIITARTEAG